MEHKCPVCNTKKESNCFQVWKDNKKGIYVECIACHTGSQEIEDISVNLEKALFKSADNLWAKIGL